LKRYSAREMIDKLISFDTVSRHSNMELIDFVRDYLTGHGIESHLVPNGDGSKANLYASVGPEVPGGVVLSGHTDVVPVDGQPWDSDPFQMVDKNGKLYGRGTCDMKSFIAIGLSLVPDMVAAGLKKPIHFALSYDEEVGCVGAPSMVRAMAENLPRPQAVIIGEPTSMEIIHAHKGINGYITTVTGHEAHSSQVQRGVSAVMTAARLVTFIEDMMIDNSKNSLSSFPFVPDYTTLHVGVIHGGTAMNIISRQAEFCWDIRNIPENDPRDFVERFRAHCEPVIREMRKISPDCNIETVERSAAPALAPEPNGAAENLCRHLTGKNSVGVVSYGTEAGHFQELEFSTVVCGPGSIDQAHQPNEFIDISQVEASHKFIQKLISHLTN